MHYSGPVHGNGRNDTLLHQVDQHRIEPDLDDMCSHAQDDRFSIPMSLCDPLYKFRKILARQLTGKGLNQLQDTHACFQGPGKILNRDL
jgi:hypothetical protein